MTDFRPLLESDPSPARRHLLDSAVLDQPPRGGKERLLAGLGLGTGAALKAGMAAGAKAVAPAKASTAVIAKWVLIGAVAGTAVTGSVETVRAIHARQVAPKMEPPPRAAAPSPAARAQAAPAAAESEPTTDLVDMNAPEATPASRGHAPRSAASTPHVDAPPLEPGHPSLAAEIASLGGVQRLLATGDASSALAALEAHERAFPSPSLGPEALLVRLEALVRLGRTDEARRYGARFLEANPNSAHTQRVRSLIGSKSPPSP